MKVWPLKRSVVVKNILAFQFFGLVYLHIIRSLYLGTSAFEWDAFLRMLWERPWVSVSFILAVTSLYFVAQWSSFLFGLFCFILLGESLFPLFGNFNKLVLILTFFYAICSTHFLLCWTLEKKKAIYRPSFDKHFVANSNEYDLGLDVEIDSPHGPLKGQLTNWDEDGLFLVLSRPLPQGVSLSGKVMLKTLFEGSEFQYSGTVVTKYANGHGIQVEQNPDPLNWKSLYGIINDRGYKPRYV